MLKCIVFDLYGTLLDIRTDEKSNITWDAFTEWMSSHGMPLPRRTLKRRWNKARKLAQPVAEAGRYPQPDLLPVFLSVCRSILPDADEALAMEAAWAFRQASTRMIGLYPHTAQALEELRRAGQKLVLLSNAQHCFTWPQLQQTGLLQMLDDVLISSDVGWKKPDAAFYQAMLTKHGLKPQECLMVGNDSTSDIAGAAGMGMDACYLRTAISPKKDPTPDCRYVYEDGDMLHLVEALRKEGRI